MLDHFHRHDGVERSRHLSRRPGAIVDHEPAALGVLLGGCDGLWRSIHARHGGPQPGERLGQKSRAAADVEDTQAPQGATTFDRTADVGA